MLVFGRNGTFSSPVHFPGTSSSYYLVAPFWARHDITTIAEVSYEVHNGSTGLLSHVSAFIRQQQNTDFSGQWMVVAEWTDVPQYGSTSVVNPLYTN